MGGSLQASERPFRTKPGGLSGRARGRVQSTEKIFQSGLADWMKLEAFREFVMPKLDYAFRSTPVNTKRARKLDRFVMYIQASASTVLFSHAVHIRSITRKMVALYQE